MIQYKVRAAEPLFCTSGALCRFYDSKQITIGKIKRYKSKKRVVRGQFIMKKIKTQINNTRLNRDIENLEENMTMEELEKAIKRLI